MTANLIGIWNGTGLMDQNGIKRFVLRLTIKTQRTDEPVQSYTKGRMFASAIYGHWRYGTWRPSGEVVFDYWHHLFVGFVDDDGMIQLYRYPYGGGYKCQLTGPKAGYYTISSSDKSESFIVRSPAWAYNDRISEPIFEHKLL
jgi:hypothetical protein